MLRVERQKRIFKKMVEEKISELQNQKDILEGVNKILTDNQNELNQQKEDLLELTSLLEKRQLEIENQNHEIQKQYDLSQHQRIKIELQNKEINDSIRYALQIQKAILPSFEHISEILKDYFILFKPRDVLSGDFYWAAKKNNKSFIVAADCTGHGIPGAVMSMLGISLLNEIITSPHCPKANEVLDTLRFKIINTLAQKDKDSLAKDGMDIALCIIDYDQMKLEFAGANNQLLLIRNKEIIEYKADRFPVGIHSGEFKPFTNNDIALIKNDLLYIFTDGYIDQVGSSDGKKLKTNNFKQLLLDYHEKLMPEQKTALEIVFEQWKGDYQQIDDVLIIGIKI